LGNTKTIFWDFDGVILDSNSIRTSGFKEVLKNYPNNEVNALLKFHEDNGGLSRYLKFRYFFENIRNEAVSESKIKTLADNFSTILLPKLANKKLLIRQNIEYIQNNYENIQMFIVSGSDEKELTDLCELLSISIYFREIKGSPIEKKELVKELIYRNKIYRNTAVLIGDSINDFDAAQFNHISFMGFGNKFISNYSNIKLF
jgi:phosphoglycolate phosphatase-like HAD superfamily hydrolase